MMLRLLLAILMCVLTGGWARVHVSPAGNDAHDGSVAAPVRTLERAQALGRLARDGGSERVVILLRGGRYELTKPLELDHRDGGPDRGQAVWAAYPGERPVITSARSIGPWTLHDPDKRIYRASVPAGLAFRQLYVDGERAVRARSPNAGAFHRVIAYVHDGRYARIKREEIDHWKHFEQVEMVSQLHFASANLRLASFTEHGGEARVKFQDPESDFLFRQDSPKPEQNQPYHFENAYEMLDAPGEWYLDRQEGVVYYIPRPGQAMDRAEAEVPTLETLLRINGTADAPVTNLTIHGLTFEQTTFLRTDTHGGSWNQAFNYNIWTDGNRYRVGRPPGAVRVDHAHGLRFEHNVIRRAGASGLDLHEGVKNALIRGNIVDDVAGNGINVGKFVDEDVSSHAVYNPADSRELTEGVIVTNNRVTRVGQDYACAVGIASGWPVGLTVSQNHVADMPYTGISLGWGWTRERSAMRDNAVRLNRVDQAMRLLGDGGGIYVLSLQPNTAISHNHITRIVRNPRASGWPIVGVYVDMGFGPSLIHDNCIEESTRMFHNAGEAALRDNDPPDPRIRDIAGLSPTYARWSADAPAPEVDLMDGTRLRLKASADATVRADIPGRNLNMSTELTIGQNPAMGWGLIRFDTHAIAGRPVKSVRLILHRSVLTPGAAGEPIFRVSRGAGAWSERGVTWETRPQLQRLLINPFHIPDPLPADGRIEVPLDPEILSGETSLTLILHPAPFGAPLHFASRELAEGPVLEVELAEQDQ